MRELSTEYVSLSKRIDVAPQDNEEYELEQTRVLIRLRLNANPDHKLDAKLLLLLLLISTNARSKNMDELKLNLEEFETDMQALLKHDWNKSKGEVEIGNVAATPCFI